MVQISSRPDKIAHVPKCRPTVFLWSIILCIGTFYCLIFLPAATPPASFDIKDYVQGVRNLPASTTSKAAVETIAYIVSITGCGSESLAEGGAVLKHSIHLASVEGNLDGRYGYRMFAVYHPDAAGCVEPLSELGYELVQRDTPVAVEDIEGEFLRAKIVQNGCCGEKELIKLEAYTFTNFKLVVHLDLDVLILKPLDDLFDAMLVENATQFEEDIKSKVAVMWPDKPLPKTINALFTRDYGMVKGSRKYKPVQGGFLVLRPDLRVYHEYVAIIKKGNFQEGKGWGGMRVGPFYGSMTIQGLLPYYYDILHPNESVDLNRCVYDAMSDNPRDQKTVNDVVQGKCRTGEDKCEDCRSHPVEDIASFHFTLCQKPWLCLPHSQDMIQHRLCRKVFHEWYRVRSDLEKSWGRNGTGPAVSDKQFFGYCSGPGGKRYVPIEKPYGSTKDPYSSS